MKQPIKENSLLSEQLEETNGGYALKGHRYEWQKYYNEKFSTKIICHMMY